MQPVFITITNSSWKLHSIIGGDYYQGIFKFILFSEYVYHFFQMAVKPINFKCIIQHIHSYLFMIREGLIDAAIGQRQYFMGYLSVVVLRDMVHAGQEATMMLMPRTEDGDVIIDTGVDIVTRDNLAEYVKLMDAWGVKHKFKP